MSLTNLYIYRLEELENILYENIIFPPEMNLFNLFSDQLKQNYNIVTTIEDAHLAFIPIDYVKLIYINNDNIFRVKLPSLPIKPPTFGSKYKKDIISFFWKNYVEKHLFKTKIPHFILYSYVLFDIDVSDIPKNIYILSYENKVTLSNNKNVVDNGSFNRIIPIPYILNENKYFNQSKIINYYFENYTTNDILTEKKYDIGFFGSICKERTENLYNYREFLLSFNKNFNFKYIRDSGDKAENYLAKVKYLFVLRGDTPTRLCFYQCFAFGVCPIIYEKELTIYSNLLLSDNINILNSVLIIPNKEENMSSKQYAEIVEKIIEKEISSENNYLIKIKNHQKIFDNLNYFKNPLCYPIKNAIEYIKSLNNPFIYIHNIETFYNSDLFPVYINDNDIINFSDDMSSQYSLEIKIHKIINNYIYKTDNLDMCDIIYIPIYTFLLSWKTKFVYNVSSIVQELNKLKTYIDYHSNLKKILIIYSDVMWDDNRCFINYFSFNKNVFFVCYESITSNSNKQISVPFVTHINYNPSEYIIPNYYPKNNLLCYCGRYRKEQDYAKNIYILDLMKYQKVPNQWISFNNKNMFLEIDELYLTSTFSLQPHGDKETRKGFYHSILLGCIPVIFKNNFITYKNVFSNIIDIEDICIIIEDDEINLIEEILKKIDENRIKNILLNFNKIKKILLYNDTNMEILYNIFNFMNL